MSSYHVVDHTPRYFGGGVEGSYHVENSSAGNLKRCFVDYGVEVQCVQCERVQCVQCE